MALPQLKYKDHFSYADYLNWPDDERWELIDGIPYAMSPAPSTGHQRTVGRLFRNFANMLDGKPCEAFIAPFDVRLPASKNAGDDEVDTVVQPDILVVCDKSKLDARGLNGAPDLVIEIISPSTASHDITTKFMLYQRHGVKEYWIVHPNDQTVMVFKLGEDGQYGRADMYAAEHVVEVPLLGELEIDLKAVFAE